jgi:hypothetical protein
VLGVVALLVREVLLLIVACFVYFCLQVEEFKR